MAHYAAIPDGDLAWSDSVDGQRPLTGGAPSAFAQRGGAFLRRQPPSRPAKRYPCRRKPTRSRNTNSRSTARPCAIRHGRQSLIDDDQEKPYGSIFYVAYTAGGTDRAPVPSPSSTTAAPARPPCGCTWAPLAPVRVSPPAPKPTAVRRTRSSPTNTACSTKPTSSSSTRPAPAIRAP